MSPIWENFANASVNGWRSTVKGVTYFLARVQMATRGTSQPSIAGTAANLTSSYYGFQMSYGKYIHQFSQAGLFVNSVEIINSGSNGIGTIAGNNSILSSGSNTAQRFWTIPNYYATPVTQRNNGTANCYYTRVDTSNNVYYAGYGGANVNLVKFNSAGTLQWQKATSVSTGAGAVDTLGNSFASSTGTNPTVHKIDTTGAYVWGSRCTNFTTATLSFVEADGTGGAFLASNVSSGIAGIARVDSAGNGSWGRQVTVSSVVQNGLAYGPDGSIYWLLSDSSGNNAYIVKFNSSGTVLWQRGITGSTVITAGGNGYTGVPMHVDADAIYLAMPVPGGNGAWEHTYCFKYPVDGSVTGSWNLGAGTVNIGASSITINSFTPSVAANTSSVGSSTGDGSTTYAINLYTTNSQTIVKVP